MTTSTAGVPQRRHQVVGGSTSITKTANGDNNQGFGYVRRVDGYFGAIVLGPKRWLVVYVLFTGLDDMPSFLTRLRECGRVLLLESVNDRFGHIRFALTQRIARFRCLSDVANVNTTHDASCLRFLLQRTAWGSGDPSCTPSLKTTTLRPYAKLLLQSCSACPTIAALHCANFTHARRLEVTLSHIVEASCSSAVRLHSQDIIPSVVHRRGPSSYEK
ncbi:hypothetical protein T265_02645 [Opisthorchis viverrini]|uniref:Uncharacterized protein n=1 Tax=Opisthorchis viverrini TaxID=6198 RepID=A0A075AI63_OPIVI|nr:hypothetical protein T265_02645 [Opisthorchis viverrini]KER31084.1 hypothetical protein T265_02645 [Opisthorchis viverrini]